jgi:hypothetical protein
MDFGWLVIGLLGLSLIAQCQNNSPERCAIACQRQSQKMIESTENTCKCEK